MDVGDIALVIAAVLGGTGAGGLLTGGVQVSRRHRLRRSIEKTAEVVEKLPADSAEVAALEAVQRVEAVRFASMTLITLPRDTRQYLQSFGMYLAAFAWLSLTFLAILLTVLPPRERRRSAGLPPDQIAWLLASAAFAILYVAILDRWLRRRRDMFVDMVLGGQSFDQAQSVAMEETVPEWLVRVATIFLAWRRHSLIRRRARRAFRR